MVTVIFLGISLYHLHITGWVLQMCAFRKLSTGYPHTYSHVCMHTHTHQKHRDRYTHTHTDLLAIGKGLRNENLSRVIHIQYLQLGGLLSHSKKCRRGRGGKSIFYTHTVPTPSDRELLLHSCNRKAQVH